MILDFGDSGNGPEVLWAGMFTLVAVVGSVLLALWSQRRDFNRREAEMRSAFKMQEQAQWSTWRRHMAERCMALISKVADLATDEVDGPTYFRILHETEELDSLLHLDCHEGGPVLGDWIRAQVSGMLELDERSVDKISDLYNLAATARRQITDWAIDPSSVLDDAALMSMAGT
jgi:hypothetical protein